MSKKNLGLNSETVEVMEEKDVTLEPDVSKFSKFKGFVSKNKKQLIIAGGSLIGGVALGVGIVKAWASKDEGFADYDADAYIVDQEPNIIETVSESTDLIEDIIDVTEEVKEEIIA